MQRVVMLMPHEVLVVIGGMLATSMIAHVLLGSVLHLEGAWLAVLMRR